MIPTYLRLLVAFVLKSRSADTTIDAWVFGIEATGLRSNEGVEVAGLNF